MRRGRAPGPRNGNARGGGGTHGALLARDGARATSGEAMTLVEVRDLVEHYAGDRRWFGLGRPRAPVRSVAGVSFGISSGKTIGLLVQSASWTTTVRLALMPLSIP